MYQNIDIRLNGAYFHILKSLLSFNIEPYFCNYFFVFSKKKIRDALKINCRRRSFDSVLRDSRGHPPIVRREKLGHLCIVLCFVSCFVFCVLFLFFYEKNVFRAITRCLTSSLRTHTHIMHSRELTNSIRATRLVSSDNRFIRFRAKRSS